MLNTKNTVKIILIIGLYTVLNLPFLTVFPPINNVGDESWRMNIAWELIQSGRPVASMFVNTPVGEEIPVTTPWIYNSILASFFYLFGPTIWIGRFLSFLCGIAVIFITYRFGRDMAGPKLGLAASLLLATTYVFSWHSREMRQEMMLLAFVMFSIHLFYLAWKNTNEKLFFFSGLMITLSLQVHMNAAIFAFTILIVYAILYRKNLLSRLTLYLTSGLMTGSVMWAIFNYIPFSSSSFATVHSKYVPFIMKMGFLDFLKSVLLSVPKFFSITYVNWLSNKYHSQFFMVITYCSLLLIALAFIIGKKRKDLGFLVSFLFLPLFVNFFLTGGWSWFHHSVFLSLSSLALAVSIVNITDVISKTSLRSLLASSLMAVFVILGVVDITYNNRLMSKYDYNSFMTRVTTVVPEDSTVMGASLYYPVFINRNNRFVGYLFLEERCPDFADEIHKLDVDYILLDNNLRVSSLVWCSEDYYRNQILGFLKSKRNIEITAHYPSRNIVMKSVYLFTVND